MARSGRTGRWSGALAAVAVCGALLAACAGPTAAPAADTGLAEDIASLQQQAATQAVRIASLETQSALLQQVGPLATRIGALETQVVQGQTAAAPLPTHTAQPTATMVPAVAGLVTEGNTKGLASAKVTITEYVDYF